MSSIRHGPISRQHPDWMRLGERIATGKAALQALEQETKTPPLKDQVLIICGRTDPIIDSDELVEDASQALGSSNLQFALCDAGHELPITRSKEIVDYIYRFWESLQLP